MTAQIGDIYKYGNVEYSCLEESNGGLFDPLDYYLLPWEMCTACILGYWCEYEIADDRLKIQTLHVYDKEDFYPPINGVNISPIEYMPALQVVDEGLMPTQIPKYMGAQTYKHLNLIVPFTGKLLLATNPIKKYYYHFGCYEPPFAFRELQSFEFDSGVLKRIVDHGETARLVRQMHESNGGTRIIDDERLVKRLPEAVREALWWYKVKEERSKKYERERIEGWDQQELDEGIEKIKRIERMREKMRAEL